MRYVFLFILLPAFVGCHSTNNTVETDHKPAKAKVISSAQFDSSVNKMVTDYFLLENNFVSANDSMINFCSRQLMKDADSLNFSGFTADSATAQQAILNTQSISAEMQGLLGETNITGKQKSFYVLSEELYDLLKLVHYGQQAIYRFECLSAVEGATASWLSNSAIVKSPYQPNSNCGKITDTLSINK